MDSDKLSDNEDNEEFITPQELLRKIEISWRNEQFAPDILMFQSELVELMMGQIAHMDENLKELSTNDFRNNTHRMELERIKYMISSYLRCRLQKIEDFTQYIISEEAKRSDEDKRLSDAETIFAEEYFKSIENHFQQLVIKNIPINQDDISKRLICPNLMSNVFIKVLKPSGTVINSNDEIFNLGKNSIHMLPYQLISDLVNKGDVILI